MDLIDLYCGGPVFLICNGPSFSPEQQLCLKRPGIVTLGLNNGAHVFRPSLWVAVDAPHRFMRSVWTDATIMKFVPMEHLEAPIPRDGADKTNGCAIVRQCSNVVGFRRNSEFRPHAWLSEESINLGNSDAVGGVRSVMLPAIRICYLLGFRDIYLVGCDFAMDRQHKYWFPEERSEAAIAGNNAAYAALQEYFLRLLSTFKAAQLRVWNTNPKSKLEVFPCADLDSVVRACCSDTSGSTAGMYNSPV